MLSWLISAGTAAVGDHVSGRSESWWTGENSLWGRITGGGSDRSDSYDVTVTTAREGSSLNPLLIGLVAYLVLIK